MNHTPGPWTILDDEHALKIRCEAEYVTVCEMPWRTIGTDPEDRKSATADAHLIAAAPELLQACKAALDCCALNLDDLEESDTEAINELQAAVAKAEGRL